MTTKLCKSCNTDKPTAEFYARSDRKGRNLSAKCKVCHNSQNRDITLKRKYGIGVKEYNIIFASQEGRCKICTKHQSELNRTLCIDHCHETGAVRGLLCVACNITLGYMNDDINILERAILYLKKEV